MIILSILSFLFPFIIFLVSIPIRALLISLNLQKRVLTASVNAGKRIKNKKKSLEEKIKSIENGTDSEKSIGDELKSISVGGKKIAIKSLDLSLKALNLSIRSLKFTLWLLRSLFVLLEVLATLVCSIFFWIVLVVLAAVVSVVLIINNSSTTITSSVAPTAKATDYFSLDWSQDFSAKLNEIEGTYGKDSRDWVELTIVSMNTMQKLNLDFKVAGFMTGLKSIESGQGNAMGSSSLHPSNGLTDLSGGNPMQFDTNWGKQSEFYDTSLALRTEWSKAYYPDCFYGISERFSTYANEDSGNTYDMIQKAFNDLGIESTPNKYKLVRYISTIAVNYNGIYLQGGGYSGLGLLTEDSAKQAVYGNALVLITFFENYGYSVNSKVKNLVTSMQSKDGSNDIYLGKDFMIKACYGMTGGNKNYPSDIDDTQDYGVITPDGSSVNGSLFSYLLTLMPDNIKNELLSNSGYKIFNGSRAHYMRVRYDLTAYLIGVWDLDKSCELLGLRVLSEDESSISDNSTWIKSCESMAQWYAKNVTTYQGSTSNKSTGVRKWYNCSLLDNKKVGDDCSAFVTACLAYAGFYPDWTSGSGLSSTSFCRGSRGSSLLSKHFKHYTPSELNGLYKPKVGDIVAYAGHVEILARIDESGNCWAYSWGAISSVQPINRNVTSDVYIRKMWSNNTNKVTDIWQYNE